MRGTMSTSPHSDRQPSRESASRRREVPITVRRPKFDYADSPRVWTPRNPTFGYRMNGGSLTLPYLEPYLIRVMRQAKEALGEKAPPALLTDIDLQVVQLDRLSTERFDDSLPIAHADGLGRAALVEFPIEEFV